MHKITTVTLTVQGAGTQYDYLQKTKELAIESKTLDVSVDVSLIINVMGVSIIICFTFQG